MRSVIASVVVGVALLLGWWLLARGDSTLEMDWYEVVSEKVEHPEPGSSSPESSRVYVDAAERSVETWARGRESLRLVIDRFDSPQIAARREQPPESSMSAPDFEVQPVGGLLVHEVGDGGTYAVCGYREADACQWWIYFGRFGQYRVLVTRPALDDPPLPAGEFVQLAESLFEAIEVPEP